MGLSALDLLLVVLYLAGITIFGVRFRRRQHSLRDYFLAGRDVPWWAIALSIVAAETSTLTIISIPGLAFDTDLGFLQVVFGYLLGRIIISFVLLPQYFRGELFTAYQVIDRRFGPRLRSVTAGLFLLTRAAAEGVRVFAVSIVVRMVLGGIFSGMSPLAADIAAIAIVTALTLLYTFEGGMTAVIWTDVVQMAIYVGGTLVGFFTLLHLVPGGWAGIATAASAAGKFRVLHFSLDPTRAYTFWAGLIGGAFLTTASHGTDQLMVQRLLAARNLRQSRRALLTSGAVILLQFTLFLLVGVMLWTFYRMQAMPPTVTTSVRIFPAFIVTRMPHVVSGLLVAAILAAAMSNLSAALNSLTSTSMVDFYLRGRRAAALSEAAKLRLSRMMTAGWGLALFALAILSRGGGRVVEVGLSIASVAYGALLGVFLLGTLSRRATERGAIVGMLCGFALNLYVWLAPLPAWLLRRIAELLGHPTAGTGLAWTWYVLLGSAVTILVGWAVSLAPQREKHHG